MKMSNQIDKGIDKFKHHYKIKMTTKLLVVQSSSLFGYE